MTNSRQKVTHLDRVVIIILRVGDSRLASSNHDADQIAPTVDPHLLIAHVRRVEPVRVAVIRSRGPARSGPSGMSVLEPTRPRANDAQICRHDLSFAHQHNVARYQRQANI